MFAPRFLITTLLATTITGLSEFSTISATMESSEPKFQKAEIASFRYKNRLLRVWASSNNRYNIPTSQWQFRYDPLQIPMTDDQGQLVVTTEQFGDSWRTSFDLVLDDEAARNLAFNSVTQAYKNVEGALPRNNFAAIPMKSIAIRIPDLTGFHPEVSLLGHQPCPPETACYNFHGPVSSVRVTVSSPSRTAADEIESLIPKCQIYFEITRRGFRERISSSPVAVSFQALRDSYFYTELRVKHSADYVSKSELRRILQISRQTLGKDLTAEQAECFDSGMLEQLWKRWTVVSSKDFKPRNWTRTYKGDQSRVDVISDSLNDIFVFDKQVEKFIFNFNSAENHGLFLFPSDGYANQRFTESELKRYLEDNGIRIDFNSNKILVRTLDFIKVDWSEFIDTNTLSEPLFTYLPLRVEKESGLMDFSSFRAKRSTTSARRTTAPEDLENRVKQLLEDNEDLKKRLLLSEETIKTISNWFKKLETDFKKITNTESSNKRKLEHAILRSAEKSEENLHKLGLNSRMQAFEAKTINEVSVLTRSLSTTVDKISTSTETRLEELNLTVRSTETRLEEINLTVTSAMRDRINAFETKTRNDVSVLTRNLSASVDKLSTSTETRLEKLNSTVSSELSDNKMLLSNSLLSFAKRVQTLEKTLEKGSVLTGNLSTSVEKLSMSTETRLAEINLTVASELRHKKSVSIQLFETVSKALAENWLCKPEWKLYCTSEKCNCYFLEKAFANWHKALYNCKRLGGDLASIHSDEESEFIGKISNASVFGAWIGLNDATTEGSFEWSDGSPVDFTNQDPLWDTGTNEGRDGDDWVYIRPVTGKWLDDTSGEVTGTGHHSVCKEQINIEQIRRSESFMKELSIKLTNRQTQNLEKAVEHSVCDPGWKLYCDSISCNCYFYDIGPGKSWSDALSNCQSLGSDLISIHSYDEMTFVKELVGVKGDFAVWIGLTKTGCEGEFAWSDGTPMDISYWGASEPEDKCNAHCGVLTNDRSWGDLRCERKQESICKMKIPKTISPII